MHNFIFSNYNLRIIMSPSAKRGLRILVLAPVVIGFAFLGSYYLQEYWGKVGEVIGIAITIAVLFVPFGLSNEKHPYDENLKLTFMLLALTYCALGAFYILGLVGNNLFCINTTGALTALLGFGLLFLFNIAVIALLMLIKYISKKRK